MFNEQVEGLSSDSEWLQLAADNFTSARYYQDAALTVQWERNADHFNSNHFRRSNYMTRQYKGRSRLFRPLSRSAERSSSSAFAQAMFSNQDLIDVVAANQNDPMQVAAARIMKQILQYRLTKTIPWYLTAMGAWQDTRVYGPCCTYTTWDYEERELEVEVPETDVMGNEIIGRTKYETKTVVVKDSPRIDMIPVENLLLDPECDWRDPINTSPYVIRLVPMHLTDILDKMEAVNDKTGEPEWRSLSEGEILSASRDSYNTVRQAREGDNRPDKTDSQDRTEFKVIWAHENFVRMGGEEYVYWTLGTQFMLTDPKPLREVYHTGKRPLNYGFSIIEAHKFSPNSATELVAGLQTSINDLSNLRMDNIRLALNKRYIIRRGAMVDLDSLMRSVPGGGIVTDDPERDVKVVDTRDVTGSSYREQERLETEANDISGTFMGSSIQNNENLNETVGGMQLLSEGANSLSEFDIRTFVETWAKPQLELLIQYIQAYETDDVIFNNSFEEAFKELGLTYDLDSMGLAELPEDASEEDIKQYDQTRASLKNKVLNDKMTINVNVGLGATSPQRKVESINYALGSIAQMPEQLPRIDGDEITKEIFAAVGFQDGARFLKGQGPGDKEQELSQADLEQAYQQGAAEAQDQEKMARIELDREIAMAKIQSQEKMHQMTLALQEGMTLAQVQSKLQIEQMKDQTRRDQVAISEGNKRNELEFKRTTGKPGI
jgi:hypothetical protein